MTYDQFVEELTELQPTLYYRAYKLCGNHPDAEDLLQDTLIKAVKNWKSFKPGTSMIAWLMTIQKNTHINNWRKKRTKLTEPVDMRTFAPHIKDQHPKTFDGNLEKVLESLDDHITNAINDLEPNFRDALLLKELWDYKATEIGEQLNIPRGTVMSRLFRARKRINQTINCNQSECY